MKKEILNPNTILLWKEVDPDNWQTLVRDILETFLTVGRGQHQLLLKAWKSKDLEAIGKAAHILKSSCGNVGADEAFELLNEIENYARLRATTNVEGLLQKFETVYPKTLNAVQEFHKKNQAT